MENTSMGYHTFAFFQKTNEEEYQNLDSDFIRYMQKTKKMKRTPVEGKDKVRIGWQFSYLNKEDKGIRWLFLSKKTKNNYAIFGVLVVINQETLIENNYIRAAREDDLTTVEEIYNREAEKISKRLLKFGACSLNRLDPCLNIDLKELRFPCTPEQMMKLIKRGNIPRYYEEREEYDRKQRRMITDKDSFYLESKSSVINYYWKYAKVKEDHPDYWNRESFRNVIRLEVQCKYLKLYTLVKDNREQSKYYHIPEETDSTDEMYEELWDEIRHPAIPIDLVISKKIYESFIRRDFYRVLRKGDYFTMDIAKDIVESYQYRENKEKRIIDALDLVNKSHGIAKAKAKLQGKELKTFNKALKELDVILVNPVTIPRRWDIKHIPNLFQAYNDSIYEEQLVSCQEYDAMKHIEKVLERVKQ